MDKFIAWTGIILSGLYLITRIRFFIKNRGARIRFVRSTIDIFLSMGILVLSSLQLLGDRIYTWYILGLFILYIIWAKINVDYYRGKTSKQNQRDYKKSRHK